MNLTMNTEPLKPDMFELNATTQKAKMDEALHLKCILACGPYIHELVNKCSVCIAPSREDDRGHSFGLGTMQGYLSCKIAMKVYTAKRVVYPMDRCTRPLPRLCGT